LAASGGDVDFHGMHPLYSPLNYPPIREAYDSAFARYRMRQEEVDRIITLLEELERECNQNGDWTSPAQTRQRIDAVYDSFQAAA
ncbi:MAG TPA: hypothetical protein VJB64_00175, partial [Patescibacteria group bacterium]|nr:hypothetical protein [Patescibacteria group bacterium]